MCLRNFSCFFFLIMGLSTFLVIISIKTFSFASHMVILFPKSNQVTKQHIFVFKSGRELFISLAQKRQNSNYFLNGFHLPHHAVFVYKTSCSFSPFVGLQLVNTNWLTAISRSNIGSRTITEFDRRRPESILRWVTAWQYQVL